MRPAIFRRHVRTRWSGRRVWFAWLGPCWHFLVIVAALAAALAYGNLTGTGAIPHVDVA